MANLEKREATLPNSGQEPHPAGSANEGKPPNTNAGIAARVACAIEELLNLQDLLLNGEVSPLFLADLRDALNRTRNTAWAVQQYQECRITGESSTTLMQVLIAERIRVAYQIGEALANDLRRSDLKLQTGQLMELHRVTKALTVQLAALIG